MPTVQPTDIESSYESLARQYVPADGTLPDQVAALAKTLHDDFIFNPDAPGGVQQRRIDSFLSDPRIGNEEQFLTSFVLLARSLGVDARIATGYKLDSKGTDEVLGPTRPWHGPRFVSPVAGRRSTT